MSMNKLDEILKELPPDLQQEVLDFAEFLKQKRTRIRQKRLRLSWAGALKEFREQYTSLDLQRKALEWWGD
jgi:hypothetical protein